MSALLLKGADKDARTGFIDGVSSTPLHLAAQHGHVSVVEIFLAAGADASAREHPHGRCKYVSTTRTWRWTWPCGKDTRTW